MITINKANPTSGEITSSLTNSADGGAGLHFDGAAGTYVDCGDTTAMDGATQFSMEFIASTSATSTGLLMSKSYSAHMFKLQFNAAGTITAHINNGSTLASPTTSGTYNDGNPKHIVLTWDNATVSIYVNGNLDGTAALAGGSLPDTTDKLALGAELNSSTSNVNNFDGIIYRARLFNYVIDPTRFYENSTVPFADQYGSVKSNEAMTANDGPYNTIVRSTLTQATVGSATASKLMADSTASSTHYARDDDGSSIFTTWDKLFIITADIYIPSGNSLVDGVAFSNHDPVVGSANTFLVSTTSGEDVGQTIAADTWVTVTTTAITFEDKAWDLGLTLADGTAVSFTGNGSDYIGIKNQKIQQSGCVADYDLAFANPTQSTMVQDRAGAADGTSSATGVTQVTPIEQLNSKSARIGTSAATPADGEVVVSGNVGIGGSPTNKLSIEDTTGIVGMNIKAATDNLAYIDFGDSGDSNIGGINYNNNDDTLNLRAGNTNRLTINSAGAVTMPSTPAFSAKPAAHQYNIAVATEVDIVLATEIFDQGANFASNTFTAPVAGRYQFNATIAMEYLDSAATYYQILLVTSNRTYTYTFDPDFGQDATYWEIGNSFLADMDASDTAKLRFYQSSGTAQTDIIESRTYFSGFLAC